MKTLLQKWLGIDRLKSQGDMFRVTHRRIIESNDNLLGKIVDFQSLICKEYVGLKDRVDKLEKEIAELKDIIQANSKGE